MASDAFIAAGGRVLALRAEVDRLHRKAIANNPDAAAAQTGLDEAQADYNSAAANAKSAALDDPTLGDARDLVMRLDTQADAAAREALRLKKAHNALARSAKQQSGDLVRLERQAESGHRGRLDLHERLTAEQARLEAALLQLRQGTAALPRA